MQSCITKLYEGFGRSKAVLCLAFLAVYTGFTLWAGGTLSGLVLFWAAVLLYIVLPGILGVKLLGLDKAMPRFQEPLTILLGTGLLTALFCVSIRLDLLWLVRGLPLALSAVCVAAWLKRGHKRPCFLSPGWFTPNRQLLALLVCGLIFLNTFAAVIKRALPSAAGDVLIDQDFLWMVGNAKSFQIAFPPQDIRFYNVRLAYHYLTELLCASLSTVTGLDCYQVMGFYMQPAMLLGLVICLYRFGLAFYGDRPLKTMLFPFSFFLFSCAGLWALLPNGLSPFGNTNITHLLTNITSQATAILYLCIFLGLWLHLAEKDFKCSFLEFCLTLCSFVMLTVGKGPVGGIVLLGILASLPFLIGSRRFSWRGLLLVGGLSGVFAVLYAMLFSAGANGGMTLDFTDSVRRTPLAALLAPFDARGAAVAQPAGILFWLPLLLLMAPAVFLPWLKSIGGDVKQFWKLPAKRLLAHACALGGVLAFLIFRHPHFSQVYFFLLGLFFINLLAVDALPSILEGGKAMKWACGALACIGLVSSVFYYVNVCGSGLRYFLRDVGVLQKYPYDVVMNTDDEAAALWLRGNTDLKTTRFATNRIHSDNTHKDGVSNFYTALSGRQASMEGYTYVADIAPWMWVDDRKEANNILFDPASTPEQILEVCAEHQITHLVFSSQILYNGSEEQLAFLDCVFTSPTVRIYAVN